MADRPAREEVGVVPPIEGELTPEEVASEFKAFNDQIRILVYESSHMGTAVYPVGSKESGALNPPREEHIVDFKALNYSLPEGEVYIRVNSSSHGANNPSWYVIWRPNDQEYYSITIDAHQDPVRLEATEVKGEYGKQTHVKLPVKDQAATFHGLLDKCQRSGDIPGDKFRYY